MREGDESGVLDDLGDLEDEVGLREPAPLLTEARRLEQLEIELLLAGLAQRYGYDFRGYAKASLTRRIRQVIRRDRLGSVSALQARLLHDHDLMMRFVETIAVHTTAMFRDPEVYVLLRSQVVPLLRTYPFVRIWHAGCATGEEVYSLAILLQEEGLYDRCRIYATDLSDAVLERARRGIFPLRAMRTYTASYLRAGGTRDFSSYYTADHEHAVLRSSLHRNLIFSQHNLVSDGAFNEFQLIVCRNVCIYFDEALREHVLQLFLRSLSNFGMLALGKRESLRFTSLAGQFVELEQGQRVYRRIR